MQNYSKYSPLSPEFPYLEHLQAIDPSFSTITKPLRNNMGEIVYEGLK